VIKLCDDKWCEDKLCVDKLAAGGGGGRDADGVQNQKQEPHTKMWGIKTEVSYVSHGDHGDKMA
jgi:hypothetical protein